MVAPKEGFLQGRKVAAGRPRYFSYSIAYTLCNNIEPPDNGCSRAAPIFEMSATWGKPDAALCSRNALQREEVSLAVCR